MTQKSALIAALSVVTTLLVLVSAGFGLFVRYRAPRVELAHVQKQVLLDRETECKVFQAEARRIPHHLATIGPQAADGWPRQTHKGFVLSAQGLFWDNLRVPSPFAAPEHQFGATYCSHGLHLAVGAPGYGLGAGVVHFYERKVESVDLVGTFLPEVPKPGAFLGQQMTWYHDWCLVHAPNEHYGGIYAFYWPQSADTPLLERHLVGKQPGFGNTLKCSTGKNENELVLMTSEGEIHVSSHSLP